jgi:hypothetical protein
VEVQESSCLDTLAELYLDFNLDLNLDLNLIEDVWLVMKEMIDKRVPQPWGKDAMAAAVLDE